VAAFKRIMEGLAAIIGQENVKTDSGATAGYAVDGVLPRAVIFPNGTKQAAEAVKCACRERLAIVPVGSGTKMAMGYPPERVDMIISTSRMNHMLDVDVSNLTMTVEAGVKFRDIQARLATEEDRCYLPLDDLTTEAGEFVCSDRVHSGCFLPVDPPFSEKATIGGIVAANSSGPRRLLYGLPRDLVLGVRFVAPDGNIVGAGGKTVKNVSGYDISKLMIGSFGTLGVVCEMTVRLLPLPERMETLLLSFGSYADACGFADAVFETKLLPAAVEIFNRPAFEAMSFKGAPPQLTPGPYMAAVALEAFDEAVTRMHLEMLEMARDHGMNGQAVVKEEEHSLFWLAVSNMQSALAGRFGGLITCRLNYPLSAWKEIVQFADETLSGINIGHTIQCHAGSGVCAVNLLMNREGDGSTDKAVQAIHALLARCGRAGGGLVVERAPVELKRDLKIWGEQGRDLILMKRIKEQLDPSSILSPGRFLGTL
jgi:glycolate oxidase FAD binding subunit